jgi:hypothetical protein
VRLIPFPHSQCGVRSCSPRPTLQGGLNCDTHAREGTSLPPWRLVTMPPDDKCVEYAWECVRLAEMADHPDLRDHLLALAREKMAELDEQYDYSNVIEFPRRQRRGCPP